MTLSTGTRLGPYEVMAPIGAGGMGEVYKAKDTRLDRIVAIKVLPEHLAESPERKARFEREAKAISQLNHPHICTLYDVGEEDGIRLRQCYGGQVDFIVMEYIQGETLAERLKKGALKLDQALEYGIQIADALDEAHRAGIVHRDLKPGNVMLTKSGVKLLDFGIAKLVRDELAAEASNAPTKQRDLTQEGMIGTVQYMAPEQLEGRAVDAQADIWALGAVLYEMLTGNKAFRGTSQASVVGAILKDEAPILPRERSVPDELNRVVQTCLEKDPEDRWCSAGDIRKILRWVPAAAGASQEETSRWSQSGWMAAGVLLASTLFFALRPAAPPEMRYLSITPPDGIVFETEAITRRVGSIEPTLSPDGSRIAFVGKDASGESRLWVRAFDRPNAEPLERTQGASSPFWSADGKNIAFFAHGSLKRIPADGGLPQTVCAAALGAGGSWSADGRIIFNPSPQGGSGIYHVSASGGQPVRVSEVDTERGEEGHVQPYFLPDGVRFLYFVLGAEPVRGLYLGSLENEEARFLTSSDSAGVFAEPGYILFHRAGVVLAQRFDANSLELSGAAVPVVDGGPRLMGHRSFDVSGDVLAHWARGAGGRANRLVWLDREGNIDASSRPSNYVSPRLSPDDVVIAVENHTETAAGDLFLYEPSLEEPGTRFTFEEAHATNPVWSPDGSIIAFAASGSTSEGWGGAGTRNLFAKPASGSGDTKPVHESVLNLYTTDWSRDGRYLLYQSMSPDTGMDLWILSIENGSEPTAYLQTAAHERQGQFSPDGRWVAYTSNESGQDQVYVQPYPRTGVKFLISPTVGREPRWRDDGRELYYYEQGRIMSVVVETDLDFRAGPPEPLFDIVIRDQDFAINFDVTGDGQRFLVSEDFRDARSAIHLVLNWSLPLDR